MCSHRPRPKDESVQFSQSFPRHHAPSNLILFTSISFKKKIVASFLPRPHPLCRRRPSPLRPVLPLTSARRAPHTPSHMRHMQARLCFAMVSLVLLGLHYHVSRELLPVRVHIIEFDSIHCCLFSCLFRTYTLCQPTAAVVFHILSPYRCSHLYPLFSLLISPFCIILPLPSFICIILSSPVSSLRLLELAFVPLSYFMFGIILSKADLD
jgi:hypothetical protein